MECSDIANVDIADHPWQDAYTIFPPIFQDTMTSHTALPLAALVCALATPAYALAIDSSQAPSDQKASIQRSTPKASKATKSTSKKSEPVVFEGVRLMTPEEDLQGNIDVSDLTNLIVNVELLAKKIFAKNKQPGTILLSFTDTPTEQDVKLAFQPSALAPERLLSQLVQEIHDLGKLQVQSGTVKFVVQFTLNP